MPLLRFMHSSNRSQPQIDFLRHSLLALSNVASHGHLQNCLLTSDCLHVLAEQLQLYRDKEVLPLLALDAFSTQLMFLCCLFLV